MTNVPEVTDADVRLWSECVKRGENEAQAIARARADAEEAGYSRGLREGAASERGECDEAVQSVPTPPEWRDLLGDWRGQAFNAGLIAASDAIRARGEGGKA